MDQIQYQDTPFTSNNTPGNNGGIKSNNTSKDQNNCNRDTFLKPSFRKLRAYAFDPSLSLKLDTSVINNITYKPSWESLKPGPVGEYIEVVDYDPSSKCFYKPVDLDDNYILAQDGLEPSEGNPQFHQQMVYAVAMTTIKNFERALGRKILWSPYRDLQKNSSTYIGRLRIYPHALREANAYYSPQKKALLFGYFSATPDSPSLQMPGSTVYTCLSHDIIAHEITHALLDGMHRRYVEATHPDSLAFHEAFADIVALFQHFTFAEVLRDQIARTGGDLRNQNLLGELAQEFGKAIGHYGSLRDAIGELDKVTGKWQPHIPDPKDYQTRKEPHDRGAILVATVFDIFLNLYQRRVADLLRIATGGRGELSQTALHPDLVNRMANEASKTAKHILTMCIRALDYCPPMDINFGDYLRALITADYDIVDDDTLQYRVAVIEAFQKRGIFPDSIKSMSVDSLLCTVNELTEANEYEELNNAFVTLKLIKFFKRFKEKISYVTDREEIFKLTSAFIEARNMDDLTFSEEDKGLHEMLNKNFMQEFADQFTKLTGLIFDDKHADQLGIARSKSKKTLGLPVVEIYNLKLASRVGPTGKVVNQIIVTLTQKRGVVAGVNDKGETEIKGFFVPNYHSNGYYQTGAKQEDQKIAYPVTESAASAESVLAPGWFIFRGGCTLIFDLDYPTSKDQVKLKYIIKKDINDVSRMKRQYDILFNNDDFSLNATYFGSATGNLEAEPFAMIHKAL
ncbi:MAG: hypothetical protein ABIQ31_04645 [Ferruginibacter sp.]